MKHHHLPHIHLPEHYQFVTFRTADSTDDFVLKLYAQNKPNHEKQTALDTYLDSSKKGAYLYGKALQCLHQFLCEKDKLLYELVCFAIMPNHVHILFKPLKHLSVVMQGIKGASAIKLNQILGQSGQFWASDYYDKLIRGEKHFQTVYTYIQQNPMKVEGEGFIGSGVLTPQKYQGMSGTKVPPPSGSEALASPRFYGIYHD